MRAVSERPGRGDDELVREAVTLGLDDDVVIRRLLAEKMRLVLQQGAGGVPIRDQDLAAYLERHADAFRKPERISLTHVFLSEDVRGDRVDDDARRALDELLSSAAPERVAGLSDPFPLGTVLRAYSGPQLVGRFGKAFAERVSALEPGVWSGPIASPYGVHLVRVDRKEPEALPSVDEVRPALTRALMRERAEQNLAHGLATLRALYEVRVEDDEPRTARMAAREGRS
jgi:hypothetical protein